MVIGKFVFFPKRQCKIATYFQQEIVYYTKKSNQQHAISKCYFRRASTNEKLTGITVLNIKEIV